MLHLHVTLFACSINIVWFLQCPFTHVCHANVTLFIQFFAIAILKFPIAFLYFFISNMGDNWWLPVNYYLWLNPFHQPVIAINVPKCLSCCTGKFSIRFWTQYVSLFTSTPPLFPYCWKSSCSKILCAILSSAFHSCKLNYLFPLFCVPTTCWSDMYEFLSVGERDNISDDFTSTSYRVNTYRKIHCIINLYLYANRAVLSTDNLHSWVLSISCNFQSEK